MKRIVYSILQYRHSLLRSETFNIGIVFYFPDEEDKMIFYCSPNLDVLVNIYPGMDYQMLVTYIKYIDAGVRNAKMRHFSSLSVDMQLKMFLKQYVLLEDATVLRFADPVIVSNVDNGDHVNIMKNFAKILLSFRDNGEHNQLRNLLMQ